MKGTCLIWSRGRHFSPSLTERGPTGIWHLAHSIGDRPAEISGTLVMVRRSSSFCACANLPNWNVNHNQEKRCTESNRGDGKLIPRATVEQFSVQVTSWKWEVARLIKQWREYRWFIHLIPKWRPINYSFVYMFMSPLCLIFTWKFFCVFYMLARHQGLINMQTKE